MLHPGLQYHLANTLRWPGLRPTQAAAVPPVLRGEDAIIIAPTAGGKTEAAIFPVLTAMAEHDWEGLSVLYVCPLRALLNNLGPRLHRYAQWLGRSASVWHGDVGQSERRRIMVERPDILLTTPESLEAMLVSTKVDTRTVFGDLRAVIVDEIHAFAGDDRGWHLLAVLERLSRIAGRPLQRIGLSATVGNPEELLSWLQGGFTDRHRQVVAPPADPGSATTELTVDYVGSIDNAAEVIAALHQGEKRLVFVDSRRRAEELGTELRRLGVTTFLSHSSLSATERRRSEEAFADARDTVIVATSTLELGIDVGDLDRVVQIDAPRTVASFLQRLGRTGRRAGTSRNCLFLTTSHDALLQTLGMLQCWSTGWVEPIIPPPAPRHIAAQQLMALCLQEHKIGRHSWPQWWGSLPVFDDTAGEILDHLVAEGYFEPDGDFLHVGPLAEHHFGRRYFSDLTAVFSAPPEFTVLAGRSEIGTIGPDLLVEEIEGPRLLLLAGRSWKVTHIDWARHRCQVEPTDGGGKAKWSSLGGGISFPITRAMRTVALGATPDGVKLTGRAVTALSEIRLNHADCVDPNRFVIALPADNPGRWWTWAGAAANRTLQASLAMIVDPRQRIDDKSLRLLPDITAAQISAALADVTLNLPRVDRSALNGLKFSIALPPALAQDTLAIRIADLDSARTVVSDPRVIHRGETLDNL
ncbi:DEAD/DEAH box helicase [Nocardia wallacei]|uniref:DEAD/DEAH box helicase n=1 Tax=Nocardia wallacei TaxID=480035 RepID=UPI002453F5DD|nr:DEAD/DEAH box helicase [Nocardia wallacei]